MKKLRNILAAALMVTSVAFISSCNDDPCKDVSCQNGGTCLTGTCDCEAGYEGEFCETLSRAKFIGSYNGNETCTVGTDSYVLTISASSVDDATVVVSNVYNQGFTVTGTTDGTSLTIPSQSTGGVTISGSGSISSTGITLTLNYSIGNSTGTNSCTFTGDKQ